VTDPITIAAIGTLIVIGSVLVTGPYISVLQSKISALEGEVITAEKELEGAAQAIQRSYHHYFPAEIKLAILNMNPNSKNGAQILEASYKSFVHGILERHVAATGAGPSQERFNEIEKIAIRAAKGDQSATSELSAISETLVSDWAKRHKVIAENKALRKEEIETLKARISFWRNVAVALQIVGLIIPPNSPV
jgi:hypothetical protein